MCTILTTKIRFWDYALEKVAFLLRMWIVCREKKNESLGGSTLSIITSWTKHVGHEWKVCLQKRFLSVFLLISIKVRNPFLPIQIHDVLARWKEKEIYTQFFALFTLSFVFVVSKLVVLFLFQIIVNNKCKNSESCIYFKFNFKIQFAESQIPKTS